MMTNAEIQRVIDRVSYKRGWQYAVYHDYATAWLIMRISRMVEHVDEPEKIIPLVMTRVIPCELAEERFLIDQLYRLTIDFELHECKEWFKINGVCYEEPHPEIKKEIHVKLPRPNEASSREESEASSLLGLRSFGLGEIMGLSAIDV